MAPPDNRRSSRPSGGAPSGGRGRRQGPGDRGLRIPNSDSRRGRGSDAGSSGRRDDRPGRRDAGEGGASRGGPPRRSGPGGQGARGRSGGAGATSGGGFRSGGGRRDDDRRDRRERDDDRPRRDGAAGGRGAGGSAGGRGAPGARRGPGGGRSAGGDRTGSVPTYGRRDSGSGGRDSGGGYGRRDSGGSRDRERGRRDDRGGSPGRRPGRDEAPEFAGPTSWGGLARRGAGRLTEGERRTGASDAWRAAGRSGDRDRDRPPRGEGAPSGPVARGEGARPARKPLPPKPPLPGKGDDAVPATGEAAAVEPTKPETSDVPEGPWEPEQWIDEGELRDEAAEAVGRGTTRATGRTGDRGRRGARSASRKWTPNEDLAAQHDEDDELGAVADGVDAEAQTSEELRKAFGPQRAARAEARLKEAGDAFRRERYEDARKTLRQLAEQAPTAASVRELFGLTLYRLGRWSPARRELEAFRLLTGSVEQHPVLADCYRALGRYAEAEELWDELRTASPSGELVAEGRIVAAGALADQGRLDDAITLLAAGVRPTKRTKPHHLRMAYALADLYERAGDLPRARELFGRVAAAEPDFVDVESRIRALR